MRSLDQLHCQASEPLPLERAGCVHQLPQARTVDEIGDEIDEIPLLAVVADLDDRRMRDLQRLRLAEESRPGAFPVAVAVAAQQANCDRMPHRAVQAPVDFAPQPTGAEPLAQLVGREQPRGNGGQRDDSRLVSLALVERAPELGDVRPPILGILRERAADRHVDPRRQVGAERRRPRHRRRSGGRSARSAARRPGYGTRPVSISKTTAPRL